MLIAMLIAAEAPATWPMPSFLTGCWVEEKAQRWTEECWMEPRGGLMLGAGRSGKASKLGDWEWMRIERDATGNPTFYGSPRGVPAVAFVAVSASDKQIEWRNPSHDYPQRIVYRRTAAGLEAEVSLADGSQSHRWSYRPERPRK